MKIDSNTSLDELMEYAKKSLQEVESGDGEFVLRDLFRGFEWNRIRKGNRTKLGSMFLSFAQHDGAMTIEATEKTSQNQQKYKRK